MKGTMATFTHNQPRLHRALLIFILLINPTGFVTGPDKIIGAPASRLSWKLPNSGCNDEKFVSLQREDEFPSAQIPAADSRAPNPTLILRTPWGRPRDYPSSWSSCVLKRCWQLSPEGEHFQFPSLWDDTKINFSKKNSTRGIEGQEQESCSPLAGQRILPYLLGWWKRL